MIERDSRVQRPGRPTARAARMRLGTTRSRLILCPAIDSSAGRNVAAAAIEKTGTRRPPTPIDCMNGTGMKTSSARPIATTAPENSVARPAVSIVATRASSTDACCSSSSRKRKTTSIE
jgi:hypothetical protein